jgi:hypothetical protein
VESRLGVPVMGWQLAARVATLNRDEASSKGRWTFDGVVELTPRLRFEGPGHSAWEPDLVVQRIGHYLRTGPPAWNPYD